ncbi:hypothetical protein T484DRAFT_1951785 [Baffinella frigidus]|nr:hypothetical protein T484DRAFT_1951785 [Cryptophyta sp. CCMP2293]
MQWGVGCARVPEIESRGIHSRCFRPKPPVAWAGQVLWDRVRSGRVFDGEGVWVWATAPDS